MSKSSETTEQSDHTRTDLGAALESLGRADRLLVALDFDGTLAPFVDQPLSARALPEAVAALQRLEALPDTWIAYISGRPLSSLEVVTEADQDALLVGSHGVEVRFGADGEDLDLTADERSRLAALGSLLEEVVARDPDIRLERKPVGFGVHTRLLGAGEAREVNEAAYAAARSVGGELTVRDGKDILEFSVREANKGDGIARLREHVRATAVLFAGDDVTDEDGFAVLGEGDMGIKVGAGETSAEFRAADPEQIARLLAELAQLRASRSV
jgi:trehalose 6-phosphate phosphatase